MVCLRVWGVTPSSHHTRPPAPRLLSHPHPPQPPQHPPQPGTNTYTIGIKSCLCRYRDANLFNSLSPNTSFPVDRGSPAAPGNMAAVERGLTLQHAEISGYEALRHILLFLRIVLLKRIGIIYHCKDTNIAYSKF